MRQLAGRIEALETARETAKTNSNSIWYEIWKLRRMFFSSNRSSSQPLLPPGEL
jgi:hypothetical protein